MPEANGSDAHAQGPQEAPAIADRPIIWIGVFLMGFLLVSVAALAFLFRLQMGAMPYGRPAPPPLVAFPQPRLQVHAPRDLARLRHDEDLELGAKAAMPIDDAMARIAARGVDAFAPLVPERPATEEAKP